MHKKGFKLIIILPVYNDWKTLGILLKEFQDVVDSENTLFLAINDGSTNEVNLEAYGFNVQIIHLIRNLGHQKAIAIGMAYAVENFIFEHITIMDADGEDKPADILKLLSASRIDSGKIIFAKRTKREEGVVFKFLYNLYKRFFKLLTGIPISFGNFCAIPQEAASKLVYVSEIWNHFSGGVIKSKIPYELLPIARGKRFFGSSKMNLTSLILHGLSSLSVHIETVSVRVLVASIIFLLFSIVCIFVVTGIRIFTDLAIPGWTSNMVVGLTLIFLQSMFFSFVLVFIILSYRTQKHFIPATDYKTFIHFIQ